MKIIRLLLSEDQRKVFEQINEKHNAETGYQSTVEETITSILKALFIANHVDARIQFLEIPDESIKWR